MFRKGHPNEENVKQFIGFMKKHLNRQWKQSLEDLKKKEDGISLKEGLLSGVTLLILIVCICWMYLLKLKRRLLNSCVGRALGRLNAVRDGFRNRLPRNVERNPASSGAAESEINQPSTSAASGSIPSATRATPAHGANSGQTTTTNQARSTNAQLTTQQTNASVVPNTSQTTPAHGANSGQLTNNQPSSSDAQVTTANASTLSPSSRPPLPPKPKITPNSGQKISKVSERSLDKIKKSKAPAIPPTDTSKSQGSPKNTSQSKTQVKSPNDTSFNVPASSTPHYENVDTNPTYESIDDLSARNKTFTLSNQSSTHLFDTFESTDITTSGITSVSDEMDDSFDSDEGDLIQRRKDEIEKENEYTLSQQCLPNLNTPNRKSHRACVRSLKDRLQDELKRRRLRLEDTPVKKVHDHDEEEEEYATPLK